MHAASLPTFGSPPPPLYREPWEHKTASVPGFQLLPLQSFREWGAQLVEGTPKDKEIVVMCHHGVRSMNLASFLVSNHCTTLPLMGCDIPWITACLHTPTSPYSSTPAGWTCRVHSRIVAHGSMST